MSDLSRNIEKDYLRSCQERSLQPQKALFVTSGEQQKSSGTRVPPLYLFVILLPSLGEGTGVIT